MDFDHVIVGGGVAGLYACYKLKHHQSKALFESTYRLGGRLLTDHYMNFVLDYGPTRFQILNHVTLVELLTKLNIEYQETEGYKSVHIQPDINKFYDDEKHVYEISVKNNSEPIFDLLELALKKILGTQWDFNNNNIFNDQRKINFYYLKCCATYNGKPLWAYGIWDLLCSVMSPDALNYIKNNSTFYHMIDYNLNAQTHICYLLDILSARGDKKLYTIKNGTEELARRLTREIESNTFIHTNHTLTEIQHEGKKLLLTFTNSTHKNVYVTTKKLFLCLNATGLQSIKGMPEQLNPLLKSVEPIKLFKLFAIIDNPPWKDRADNIKYINNTFVPCREIHYRYNPEKNIGELLLYGDFPSINYWKYYVVNREFQVNAENNSNPDLKEQILNILHRIFPTYTDINIIHYGIRDWSIHPFNGGVHFWKPNTNPYQITQQLRSFKIGDNSVHICGEAFAFNQGYIESALTTVNEALANTQPIIVLNNSAKGLLSKCLRWFRS